MNSTLSKSQAQQGAVLSAGETHSSTDQKEGEQWGIMKNEDDYGVCTECPGSQHMAGAEASLARN